MAARGRPRGFDREAALREAMRTFWARGYEGASMAELTAAMGVNPPSLYAAFGSKDALFRETLDLYERDFGSALAAAVEAAPTARAGVEAFLRRTADEFARPGRPPGCMITLTAASAYGACQETRGALKTRRAASTALIEARLSRGVAEGDLPAGLDIAAISGFYVTVQQGMSIQAVDGASAARLHAVADAAMAAWGTLATSGLKDTSA